MENKEERLSEIINTFIFKELEQSAEFASGKLLDIGCGRLPYFSLFYNSIDEYIGIDLNVSKDDNKAIKFVASADKIPLKDSTINTVLCTEVIEHVCCPSSVFKEINRVLQVNGALILTTPQTYWLHKDPTDFYRFTKDSLDFLANKYGFEIIYIKNFGGIVTFSADFLSKILRIFLFEFCNSIRKTVFKNFFKDMLEYKILHSLVILPQKIYLYLYFFIDKRKDRFILKKIIQVLDNWNELFTLGHILVARKIKDC